MDQCGSKIRCLELINAVLHLTDHRYIFKGKEHWQILFDQNVQPEDYTHERCENKRISL